MRQSRLPQARRGLSRGRVAPGRAGRDAPPTQCGARASRGRRRCRHFCRGGGVARDAGDAPRFPAPRPPMPPPPPRSPTPPSAVAVGGEGAHRGVPAGAAAARALRLAGLPAAGVGAAAACMCAPPQRNRSGAPVAVAGAFCRTSSMVDPTVAVACADALADVVGAAAAVAVAAAADVATAAVTAAVAAAATASKAPASRRLSGRRRAVSACRQRGSRAVGADAAPAASLTVAAAFTAAAAAVILARREAAAAAAATDAVFLRAAGAGSGAGAGAAATCTPYAAEPEVALPGGAPFVAPPDKTGMVKTPAGPAAAGAVHLTQWPPPPPPPPSTVVAPQIAADAAATLRAATGAPGSGQDGGRGVDGKQCNPPAPRGPRSAAEVTA